MCMMVCPFGAIHTASVKVNGHVKRTAVKCDLCTGSPGGPACVTACPTKAISIATPRQVMESAIHDSSERFLAALATQEGLTKKQASPERAI